MLVSLLAICLTVCNMQTVEKFEQMQEQECSVDTDPTSEQPEVEEQTLSRK